MKTIAKPIEMISWTEENGQVHPVRFKIATQDGEKNVYPVLKVFTTELRHIAGNKVVRYNCEISVNSLVKLCEIRYEIDTCKWVLFKI